MRILPVLDLMDGQVVRAVAGNRADYRPIASRLTNSSDPVAVAAALLDLAPFSAFYVADLDAITANGAARHQAALLELCTALASRGVLEVWLDTGGAPWQADLVHSAADNGIQVVVVTGSESLAPGDAVACDGVLSLDYRHNEFLGPAGLDGDAVVWPQRLVVMDLSVVGVGQGPALTRIERLMEMAAAAGKTDIEFHAAGGVRDAADLRVLAAKGVHGALIATALHDGRLDRATLEGWVT